MNLFHTCLAVLVLSVGSARAASSSVTYTYDTQGRLVKAVYVSGLTTSTVTYNLDVMGNRTSVVTAVVAPQASITATQCRLVGGLCTSTVQWSTSNVPYAYVCVTDSATPSTIQLFAAGGSGTSTAPWIQNAMYTFEINGLSAPSPAGQQCVNQGGWLASVTVQPTNYTP